MIPIEFNITRKENKFNLSIAEDNKEDFNYLVSGINYTIMIQIKKNDSQLDFIINVNLTSPENDEGYGNGPYNISHFTLEPNVTKYEIYAGEKYLLYLNVRTAKDLLYHRILDINEHVKFNKTFEDESFTFNISNINSTLGIFLIELFSTKATYENEAELVLTFDNIIIEKKMLSIQGSHLPSPNNSYIVYYTQNINEDIQPIEVYILLKDDYNNIIYRNDILYKKQLFIMYDDEKPEQNIDINLENKTFILNFVSDYNRESFNLKIYFNYSGNLTLIKDELIVNVNIEPSKLLEPEPLITKIAYKTGVSFLYKNIKLTDLTFDVGNEEEGKDNSNELFDLSGDYLLYIREKHYEKGENNTKMVLYTGYMAILKLRYKNRTTNEESYIIYDQKLINIYNEIRNDTEGKNYIPLNNTENNSSGFFKIEFYENGDIKQMYYPKVDNFLFDCLDHLRETAELIIPKISSELFSQDIQSQFDELQKDLENTKDGRNLLMRRLSESTHKKNKVKRSKAKKAIFRKLDEEGNETFIETEYIPTEKDIDIQLREIKYNEDNTSNITLLSCEEVASEEGKLTGSLDNKTVLTKVNEDGIVSSISQSQKTELVSGIPDPNIDDYIYNNTYSEDSLFEKDDFLTENETEYHTKKNEMQLKGLNIENSNSVNLLDKFFDDNGTLIEHFINVEYEAMNNTVYQNYLLEKMGDNFTSSINGSNMTFTMINISEIENGLRRLVSSDYPYYGQKIINNVKDVHEKSVLGITSRTYMETTIYPHNGITKLENINILGSKKNSLTCQYVYSNNHIIIKNKNILANEFCKFIDTERQKLIEYDNNILTEIKSSYEQYFKDNPKNYSYDNLFDNFIVEVANKADEIYNKFLNNIENFYEYSKSSENEIQNSSLVNQFFGILDNIKYNNSAKINTSFESVIHFINNFEELIRRIYNNYDTMNQIPEEDYIFLLDIVEDINT